MSRKPLIIYHAPCADGFTAAWVAWREFGKDAEYLPQGYSDEPEVPDVDDRLVYILDFCYPEAIMREIADRAETVILLDHHVSAEKEVAPLLAEGLIRKHAVHPKECRVLVVQERRECVGEDVLHTTDPPDVTPEAAQRGDSIEHHEVVSV